jgi:hypothetical protein
MERLFPSTTAPPLPLWRQAQVADFSHPPPPPPPWPAPPWGSLPTTEPSHEPESHQSQRSRRRIVMVRALDPDHLLRHELPSEPGPRFRPTRSYDSDDSLESYASSKSRRSRTAHTLPEPPATTQPLTQNPPLSSFRGGTATNAFVLCVTSTHRIRWRPAPLSSVWTHTRM